VGDVLALLVGGVLCMFALTVRLIRADLRSGVSARMDRGGWLLLGTGMLAIGCGTALFWIRLFSS
jgi:hypothetical protein